MGDMLPWFIESDRIKSEEEVFVKLEGLESKEAARRVVQKAVWLTEADFDQYAGKSAPISLVGFRMIDGDTDLGEISEMTEQPHQVLCKIDLNRKEALIKTVNEETLLRMDCKASTPN